jgi:hypothetical protein
MKHIFNMNGSQPKKFSETMEIRMEGQVQLGGFGAWCGKRYQGCPEGLGILIYKMIGGFITFTNSCKRFQVNTNSI